MGIYKAVRTGTLSRSAAVFFLILVLPSTAAYAQRTLEAARTSPAQTTEEIRVALVIGNSAYKESPLTNPVNDATDIAKALQDAGFRVIVKRNANTRDMRQAIREFGNELRRAHVGLFYFAGHGLQVRGNNYLMPVGADIQSEADAEDLAIDANYPMRTMEDAQVKVSIVILDACRNNPFARSFRSASRGLAQMTAATGSVIAFATAPGAVAADGNGRNGLYTKHLLASLNQSDTDILKVFQRTRAGVVKETGGKQTPWESTSLIGDFYFRSGAQSASAAPFAVSASAPQQQIASAAPSNVVSPSPVRPGSAFRDCDVCPEMVTIPSGVFIMGSPESEPGRFADEGPQHRVTIGYFLAVGKYKITFDEWDSCVREASCSQNPSDVYWGRGRRPVINVSWNDAKEYITWLSRKTGKSYRLLSEAEWEYAARAGTTTPFSFGTRVTPQQANYDASVSYAGGPTGTREGKTVEVGKYAPNPFGLHDVHGNVWEWVEDCKNPNYSGAPNDGTAWTSGDCGRRILRGGSWYNNPRYLRSALRGHFSPMERNSRSGLRVATTN